MDAYGHDILWDSVFHSPAVFGRLLGVAELRSAETGEYQHRLASQLGVGDVDRTLRRMHRDVFSDWLNLTIQQQARDLAIWLNSLGPTHVESGALLRGLESRLDGLLPSQYLEPERRLFFGDFQMARIVVKL